MLTFAEAATLPAAQVGEETHRLAAAGVNRGMLIPARFEEEYYRHANLPEQLRRLFAGIQPERIDEDLLEAICPRAEALVRTSALLDDAIQVFYRALGNAGMSGTLPDVGTVHLRRPGQLRAEEAQVTPPGMAALHALKRLWAHDWTFEAVLARLDESGSIALEARPTLILPGLAGQLDPATGRLTNSTGLVGLL